MYISNLEIYCNITVYIPTGFISLRMISFKLNTMKNIYLYLMMATFISIQFGCVKDDDGDDGGDENIKPVSVTDVRDGQVYATANVGDQIWFTENLNYEVPASIRDYRAEQSWWYNNDEENGKIYGRLYTWEAALSACPSGWHLPSNIEWNDILINNGVNQSELNIEGWIGTEIGEKMKSTSGWNDNGNGTNASQFNGLPGGTYNTYVGEFGGIGEDGYWWSSSQHSNESAYEYDLSSFDDKIYFGHWGKIHARSIRCVKDK